MENPTLLKPLNSRFRWLPELRMVAITLGLLTSFELKSQCNADVPLGLYCEEAPFLCLKNACFDSGTIPFQCCVNFCGINTVINNPRYFKIIATEPDVDLEIHVDFCYSGSGLQCALIENCPWSLSDIIDCVPEAPAGSTMQLQAFGLIPGEMYWLLIDGLNEGHCQFTVTDATGIFSDFEQEELTTEETFLSDSVVCANYNSLYLNIGPLNEENAFGYYWIPSWSGDTLTGTIGSNWISVPGGVPDGLYSICVASFNGCDTSNEICLPLRIQNIPPATKPTATFCSDAFPFQWHNKTIGGPGTYKLQFTTPDGCKFDSTWIVQSYPVPLPGDIDTVSCTFPFYYEGIQYHDDGDYALVYPGGNINGCDSTALLHLVFSAFEGALRGDCQNDTLYLHAVVLAQYAQDSIHPAWTSCTNDSILSQTHSFFPDTAGCYRLLLDNNHCRDTIEFHLTDSTCFHQCHLVSEGSPCPEETTVYFGMEEISKSAELEWWVMNADSSVYYQKADTLRLSTPEAGLYRILLNYSDSSGFHVCEDVFTVPEPDHVAFFTEQTDCDTCAFLHVIADPGPVDLTISNSVDTFELSDIVDNTLQVCFQNGASLPYRILRASHAQTGCDVLLTSDSTVTILIPQPPSPQIIQMSDTLWAFSAPDCQYEWLSCENHLLQSQAEFFIPAASGCYCLVATNAAQCADSVCIDFILSATTLPKASDFTVFPNPTTGTLDIQLSNDHHGQVKWNILNLMGQKIWSGTFLGPHHQIDLGSLATPGVYTFQVFCENLFVGQQKIELIRK